jgi:hypothetical protein
MSVAKYAGLFLIAAGTVYGAAIVLSLISLKSLNLGVDIYKGMYEV